jgi:hypothetical protein
VRRPYASGLLEPARSTFTRKRVRPDEIIGTFPGCGGARA